MKNKTLLIGLIGLLASCGVKNSQESEEHLLLVSIEPQKYILEQLVDSSFTIKTILGKGADPETFDPATSERMAVDRADIYFTTGVLTFEKKLENSTKATEIVDTSKGAKLLFGTHGHSHHVDHSHHHEDADPHYWSSISGAKTIAMNMTQALIAKYPDKERYYSKRLEMYSEHLDSLDNVISERLNAAGSRTFAIWHPSLSYFAKDYNLEQLAVGLEGKEMSARGLKEAIENAKEKDVKVFFFQKEYDSRQAQAINTGIGSRIVEINPLEYDWENQLLLIAYELSE